MGTTTTTTTATASNHTTKQPTNQKNTEAATKLCRHKILCHYTLFLPVRPSPKRPPSGRSHALPAGEDEPVGTKHAGITGYCHTSITGRPFNSSGVKGLVGFRAGEVVAFRCLSLSLFFLCCIFFSCCNAAHVCDGKLFK